MSQHSRRGKRWERTRRGLLDKHNWTCSRCSGYANEVHHVLPLYRGGAPYDEENLEVVCKACHLEHHLPNVLGLREWWRHMKGQHA